MRGVPLPFFVTKPSRQIDPDGAVGSNPDRRSLQRPGRSPFQVHALSRVCAAAAGTLKEVVVRTPVWDASVLAALRNERDQVVPIVNQEYLVVFEAQVHFPIPDFIHRACIEFKRCWRRFRNIGIHHSQNGRNAAGERGDKKSPPQQSPAKKGATRSIHRANLNTR
jgi:hypothetical protein